MEKVRPRCGQPSDRGRLKNRTEQVHIGNQTGGVPFFGVCWFVYRILLAGKFSTKHGYCKQIINNLKHNVTVVLSPILSQTLQNLRWLGSRVVSVLDSGAEGPGFKSQPRRCRVTV